MAKKEYQKHQEPYRFRRHGSYSMKTAMMIQRVEEIVEESGTSKGSFYHYFSGKDAF